MKKRLRDCFLFSRLGLLLAALALYTGAAAVPTALGMFSDRAASALWVGGVVLFCALAGFFVLLPLRSIEKLFSDTAHTLESRLAALGKCTGLQKHPLGRALGGLRDEIDAQYAADLLRKQAELSALQSQINPHFLYNTLDSIRGQALAGGAADIADMTEALSTFFRYSISNRNAVVSLEEELENVRSYFKIQQFRFNNRFRLTILPTQRENLEECRLPKLSLQPIVENAILHGVEGKLGGSTITIRIHGTAKLVQIIVSDDGVGISPEALRKLQAKLRGESAEQRGADAGTRSTGMALVNIARRIRLLYGDIYGLEVMSTVGAGTDAVLTLPRRTEEADAAE